LINLYKAENANNDKFEVYGGDDRIGGLTKKVIQNIDLGNCSSTGESGINKIAAIIVLKKSQFHFQVGLGEIIKLGSSTIECMFTPCHTTGHICYYLKSEDITLQKPAVFTGKDDSRLIEKKLCSCNNSLHFLLHSLGDTLFIAGCGRFFEGTPQQMHSALIEKLGNLPLETVSLFCVCSLFTWVMLEQKITFYIILQQVFCGHEYTVNNLKFALKVEPNNEKIKQKLTWSETQRSKKAPTVPSTIEDEKETNPFMRVAIPEVQKAVQAKDSIDCMGIIRSMKDNFRA